MTFIDVETLLEPVSAEAPAGENLEYDPAFLAFERATHGKPERQMGSVLIPAEPPEYLAVIDQGKSLLARSKDLRIAAHLVTALAHHHGYQGLRDGLRLVHGMLERYWGPLHPQLDPDDGNDPVMRVTALSGLSAGNLLSALRAAPLVESRSFGSVGLREISIATGELAQPQDGLNYEPAMIEGAFQEVDLGALGHVAQDLKQVAATLSAIDSIFENHGGGRGPDLSSMAEVIRQASSAVEPRLSVRQGMLDAESAAAEGARPAGRAARGEIASREDVLRALDQICAYYARYEPSSPLPMLLERCKRLVPMSFREIVQDIVPDAMSQVELIAGRREG